MVRDESCKIDLASIEARLREIVSCWQPKGEIDRIAPLTPDASARRYFRITFRRPIETSLSAGRTAQIRSTVAMVFLSTAPAETGGGLALPSDQTYVELTSLFESAGLAVPALYHDKRDQSILLIEDCGDVLLGDLLLDRSVSNSPDCNSLACNAPAATDEVVESYFAAISELVRLQSIAVPPGHFLGQRRFSAELFYKEVCEFRDFYLKDRSAKQSRELDSTEAAAVEGVLIDVASAAAALPSATVHRDYHSWNLLVQPGDRRRIRIIDFQDALQGPRHYDLAGLLNDRDTDSLLGPENYSRILARYREASRAGADFDEHFVLVSIQRDLKVAGRFGKLTACGVGNYQRWVPGTVRRLRRNLQFQFSAGGPVDSKLKSGFSTLAAIIDEFGGGA